MTFPVLLLAMLGCFLSCLLADKLSGYFQGSLHIAVWLIVMSVGSLAAMIAPLLFADRLFTYLFCRKRPKEADEKDPPNAA
jgi:hypothetical protein